jgi:hypothetical protein
VKIKAPRKTYAERRFGQNKVKSMDSNQEYLTGVSIKRGDDTLSGDYHAHWELRYYLGDPAPEKPMQGDVEGFTTNKRQFVSRAEAAQIGIASGQVSSRQAGREILSSDVNWKVR